MVGRSVSFGSLAGFAFRVRAAIRESVIRFEIEKAATVVHHHHQTLYSFGALFHLSAAISASLHHLP